MKRATGFSLVLLTWLAMSSAIWAQDAGPAAGEPEPEEAPAIIEQRLSDTDSLTLVSLVLRGGKMMIPLGVMSVIVVALTLERLFALRRGRILPYKLQRELSQLRLSEKGLDPREAYRLCKKYPSAMANVVKAMLHRIGRPQSEVEHAVAEATEREADRLYGNVRWISLMGSVAPLLGLMGTVWGIIWTFYKTTQLEIGADRADQLAGGIFVALVTTLGGLTIAIPAMIFAQYFESRIVALFHEMDEVLFDLIPGFEHYEGKLRAKHRTYDTPSATSARPKDVPHGTAPGGPLEGSSPQVLPRSQ
ncbi:MotA/TolQ/ExbB proton channel family protein [Bremerella cremea]|uniref:MotA/TolQ/ExbB proton channel family protein n=1 Tax=Bremerella cremea TaxID=1031537 RepID=UPI0031E60D9F